MEEAFNTIINTIKANPEFKHVKCIIDGHSISIIGKYGYIAKLFYYPNNTPLQYHIGDIIHYIRTETRPDNLHRAKRNFYENNFPCLAEEFDYLVYQEEEDCIENMLAGAGPIEQVCPALFHWDLLAFERKIHAALDDDTLPMPIREEIFSLFG